VLKADIVLVRPPDDELDHRGLESRRVGSPRDYSTKEGS